MSSFELNEEQTRAVEADVGPVLVAAGPGSGKTTVLLHRVVHLVREEQVPASEVGLVTFTREAAREMTDRLADHLEPETLDAMFRGTIHSLVGNWLNRAGLLSDREWLSTPKARSFLRDRLREHDEPTDRRSLQQLETELSRARNRMESPEDYEAEHWDQDVFETIANGFLEWKQREGWMDYDDLLVKAYVAGKQSPASLPAPPKHLLVDEFQDTSPLQFEVLTQRLEADPSVFAVGDVDQSLYGWRGADPEVMLSRFRERFSGSEIYRLETNYRSRSNLVQRAERLIEHNEKRIDKPLEPTRPDGDEPDLIRPDDDPDEAEVVFDWLEEQSTDDAAVLYRTNLQGLAFLREAHERQVGFEVAGGILNPFDHWVGRDLLAYLGLALEGLDRNLLQRIIYRPNRYISPNVFDRVDPSEDLTKDNLATRLEELGDLNSGQVEALKSLQQDVRVLAGSDDVEAALDYVQSTIGYREYLEDQGTGTGLDSLHRGVLAMVRLLAEDWPEPEEFLRQGRRLQQAGNDWWRELVEPSEDSSQVVLSTLHSAKGTEHDTVALAGLVEDMAPHENGNLEEERRLVYVGLTRARERVLLSVPRRLLGSDRTPSRFIREYWPDHPVARQIELDETSTEKGSSQDVDDFEPGERLHHRKFGTGTIQELSEGKGEVEFDTGGHRTLQLEHCLEQDIITPVEATNA